jgi:hypothetical protein
MESVESQQAHELGAMLLSQVAISGELLLANF